MRRLALLLLGVVLGAVVHEHHNPARPVRKARETHRLAIERPKTIRR